MVSSALGSVLGSEWFRSDPVGLLNRSEPLGSNQTDRSPGQTEEPIVK